MSKRLVKDFLYENLTYKMRGAIFNVYNQLGFGHKELVYHKALHKELSKLGVPFESEKPLRVYYNGETVGNYKPDFIVDDKIVLEIKAVPFIHRQMEKQLVNYLKVTGYQLGLLVNFGASSLDIRRKVWSKNQRESAH